ncbi:MAG: hypothetical protein HC838_14410, partial [Spirulinaceae cyanobacterium RM2_2_10]|nr:hypothetical protein [Spirulinaceae cyanobacterium RM2_2_10]
NGLTNGDFACFGDRLMVVMMMSIAIMVVVMMMMSIAIMVVVMMRFIARMMLLLVSGTAGDFDVVAGCTATSSTHD